MRTLTILFTLLIACDDSTDACLEDTTDSATSEDEVSTPDEAEGIAAPLCSGGEVIWESGSAVGCLFSAWTSAEQSMCLGATTLTGGIDQTCYGCALEPYATDIADGDWGSLTLGTTSASASAADFTCLNLTTEATGMTWKKHEHDDATGTDRVGCGDCDPYYGDTVCSTELPVLCLKVDGAPDPGVGSDYYDGWAAGHIAPTLPIRGDQLTSSADGDALCQTHFGPGWAMAEFHDGGGGWNWNAYGDIDDATTYWVYIDDQADGNCW